MSPSPASAPRRRGAPDAFGAARLLYEKTAGRSCRRRARPTFHSTTGVTALQRAPSDKGPRPTGNLPLLDRPPAAASGSSEDVACAYGISPFATDLRRRPSGPKRAGGRSCENGLASRLDHRSRRAEARHPQRPTPDGSPWEGPPPSAASPHPTPSLPGRVASGRGPTLSRTVRSVTRNRHHDNRAAPPKSQIPVHGFPIGAQFIDRLSTELPTGRRPS